MHSITKYEQQLLSFLQQSWIVHPFTCQSESDSDTSDNDSQCSDRVLLPTLNSWKCKCGEYLQEYDDHTKSQVAYAKSIISSKEDWITIWGESITTRLRELYDRIFKKE